MRRIVADYPLVITALLLSVFGVAMVYSAGQTDTPTAVARVYRSQMLWLGIGMLGAYGISRSSVRFIEWVTLPAYLLSVLLLAATLVIGAGAGTAASTLRYGRSFTKCSTLQLGHLPGTTCRTPIG